MTTSTPLRPAPPVSLEVRPFDAPLGAEVLELGVVNATIHMIDECCPVQDLESLHRVYHGLMARLLGGAATG